MKPSKFLSKRTDKNGRLILSIEDLIELDKRFIDKDTVIGNYMNEKKAELIKEIDNLYDIGESTKSYLKKKIEEILK